MQIVRWFGVMSLFVLAWALAWFLMKANESELYIPVPVPGVEMDCHHHGEPVVWSYCINQVLVSDNQDVLYYLHARNGNATWWNDRDYHTGQIYEAWREQGQAEPVVVSVSFGPLWMLSDHDQTFDGGLLSVFTETVIPTVETKLGRMPTNRMVAGISMGGFNTLLLAMKTEGLFTKAAAICSPVPTVSHHDGSLAIISAARETGTSFQRTLMLWRFSHRYYPTPEIWAANDPLSLSAVIETEGKPDFYVTCGKQDPWGCFAGSERLTANLEAAGASVIWAPREGGHCDLDYAAVASFLSSAAP